MKLLTRLRRIFTRTAPPVAAPPAPRPPRVRQVTCRFFSREAPPERGQELMTLDQWEQLLAERRSEYLRGRQ